MLCSMAKIPLGYVYAAISPFYCRWFFTTAQNTKINIHTQCDLAKIKIWKKRRIREVVANRISLWRLFFVYIFRGVLLSIYLKRRFCRCARVCSLFIFQTWKETENWFSRGKSSYPLCHKQTCRLFWTILARVWGVLVTVFFF